MLVGHTKFSPDWCFGLLKQRLRRCTIDCLDDLVKEVERSADANQAQLVGTQSGETLVPMYNWVNHFNHHFRQLQNIKSYHSFHFSCSFPGQVAVKEYSDSEEKIFTLLVDDWNPVFTVLPEVIKPEGLSEERQLYLYNNIRPFCREEVRDIVFPPPTPITSPPSPPLATHNSTLLSPPTSTPPNKRRRICSSCGNTGHNKRTCPQ